MLQPPRQTSGTTVTTVTIRIIVNNNMTISHLTNDGHDRGGAAEDDREDEAVAEDLPGTHSGARTT